MEKEKYLSISLNVGSLLAKCLQALQRGQEKLNVYAKENKKIVKGTEPLYKNTDVAVWLNEQEIKETQEEKKITETQI